MSVRSVSVCASFKLRLWTQHISNPKRVTKGCYGFVRPIWGSVCKQSCMYSIYFLFKKFDDCDYPSFVPALFFRLRLSRPKDSWKDEKLFDQRSLRNGYMYPAFFSQYRASIRSVSAYMACWKLGAFFGWAHFDFIQATTFFLRPTSFVRGVDLLVALLGGCWQSGTLDLPIGSTWKRYPRYMQ